MLPLLVEIKKTTTAAKEIASLRSDKVLGIGNIDVRKVQNLKEAVDKTVEELGRIDFVIAVLLVISFVILIIYLQMHLNQLLILIY